TTVAPLELLPASAGLPLLRLLGLLSRLLCFLRHWSNPPLRVGLMRKVVPRHRAASAAWHSARECRPLLALLRAQRRAPCRALWRCDSGQKKRWGSTPRETAPLQSGQSYFFFAFLAFLAAFLAFFAIGPPAGSSSCLMATLEEITRSQSECCFSESQSLA